MTKTIHKIFWAWQYEKEEQWLNQMSNQGYMLTHVGFFCYTFEYDPENTYQYQLELLEHLPNHPKSQAYIAFLEETGISYVGSIFFWAYFRKPADQKGFCLYSDSSSRLLYFVRLAKFFLPLGLANFIIGAVNVSLYFKNTSAVFNLCAGSLNLLLSAFVAYFVVKLLIKYKKIKQEHSIWE